MRFGSHVPKGYDDAVKRCPVCAAVSSDGGMFCHRDGARLVASSTSSASRTEPPVVPLPVGTNVGRFVVTALHGPMSVLARTDDGHDALLIIGDPSRLREEAYALAALERVEAGAHFPRLIELGDDMRRGPFLALTRTAPHAPRLADAPPRNASEVRALAAQALAFARAIEERGFAWQPAAEDFLVEDGQLRLERVRAPWRLAEGGALDASPVLEALATALPVERILAAPTRLVRLLTLPKFVSVSQAGRGLSSTRAQAELDRVDAELARVEKPRVTPGAATDRGRRGRNEDAVAVDEGAAAAGGTFRALVVCDGISVSAHPELAAALAAATACDVLAARMRAPDAAPAELTRVMRDALAEADAAMTRRFAPSAPGEGAGTTIVAALVVGRRAVIGWVGDSRAYWVAGGRAERLTRDHSWVSDVVLRGTMTETEARAAPLGGALTRCLGPLEHGGAGQAEADIVELELAPGGVLVLCTDGLWSYLTDDDDLAPLVRASIDAQEGEHVTARGVARALVHHALACGGHDNVGVAVHLVDEAAPR
jgi:serine/threonine protein phosphatase PrpC